jgi:hypothetical protein
MFANQDRMTRDAQHLLHFRQQLFHRLPPLSPKLAIKDQTIQSAWIAPLSRIPSIQFLSARQDLLIRNAFSFQEDPTIRPLLLLP